MENTKIAVVTDSNSGITQQQAKELGVTVLPMPFYINEQLFLEGITLTQEEFYKKLEEELDNLKTVKRSEIAEKIKVARGYGDLSENAEYDAAKEEQAVVEARIADLEATLKVARIMDDSDLSLDTVSIGMHVRILAEGDEPDEAEEYDITGSTEADIDQGRISDESPVGAALIGHKTGDKVDVTLPNGNILEYTILGVSRSR